MKRTALLLLVLIALGSAFVGYWVYQRYVVKPEPKILSFRVERGDLNEIVRVRGTAVAEKEFDLEFPSPGIVERVSVREGQTVKIGAPLMTIETTDLGLETRRLLAMVRLAEANVTSAKSQLEQFQAFRDAQAQKLEELKRGARREEIEVSEATVARAEQQSAAAQSNLVEAEHHVYSQSVSAIRDSADPLFEDPRAAEPRLSFVLPDSILKQKVELARREMEGTLSRWSDLVNRLSTTDLSASMEETRSNLIKIKTFLDLVTLALSEAIPSPSVSATTISSWKMNTASAKIGVNTSISELDASEEKWRIAEASLLIAQKQLALLKAGSTAEQIAAQEALVRQADANIRSQDSVIKQFEATLSAAQVEVEEIRDRIRKATLYAPATVVVVKINLEPREFYRPGVTAISLETAGRKVQADVSELDIGKIRGTEGNEVTVQFDAFPKREYAGRLLSIEPRPILKEGDMYYRVNFIVEELGEEIRTGMNADLLIRTQEKKGVLTLPELAVSEKDGKWFVTRVKDGLREEVEVKTGISDGERIEILEGVSLGDVIVVSAD